MNPEFNPAPCLQLSDVIPSCSRSVLLVGDLPEGLAHSPSLRTKSTCRLETLSSWVNADLNAQRFDCVLIGRNSLALPLLIESLGQRTGDVAENGRIAIFFRSARDMQVRMEEIDALLSDHGLLRYHWGVFCLGGKGSDDTVLIAVKSDYNPVMHARQLARTGRPDWAISTLNAIPDALIQDNSLIAGLALEKQNHYFSLQRASSPPAPPHKYFSKQRREFAQVTALTPGNTDAYHTLAEYWSYLGRGDMSRRVLRSIQHAEGRNLPIRQEHGQPDPYSEHTGLDADALWETDNPLPRILIITHDDSDYGMDTLYHGLCCLLGKENVIEFPWKPTLHGQNIEAAQNYPCVFNYPGEPLSVDHLSEELRLGKFDLILYGDVVQMAYLREVRQLLDANPNVPVVLYDTWDDCYTPLDHILKYIGRNRFDVMFKREMLLGVDYEPNTHPLPFGYAQPMVPGQSEAVRNEPIFWAGKKEYGLRPLYVDSLERRFGRSFDRRYDQSTYRSKLAHSRIGLSFFGCGFDSVRYWELPANGVMLMAERPPIRITNNFVDGQSAVFFDDLADMEAKLDYYLQQPEATARIAAAGHAHFLKHHTTLSRARQFLGIVNLQLGGRLSERTRPISSGAASNASAGDHPLVHLGLVKGENYGWGVCSRYLIDELSRFRAVHVLNEPDGSDANQHLEGKLFQALTDINFQPLFEKVRARENYGYTFFENELTRRSVEHAKRFDLVLAGSTWCRDRMQERGISNCGVLIQGIDPELFYPIETHPKQDRFVIFSGGKFELRKGQDLVLRAVKVLQDKYPDVYLLNCWYNLWPQSVRQMANSAYIDFSFDPGMSWDALMRKTYVANGLDPRRVTTMELVPYHQQRALFEQTDIGVFPNRCEGGTNLVLMEYMACAKPVIASYTSGHMDIVTDKNALLLHQLNNIEICNDQGTCIGRWKDPDLDELIARLEYAYHHRGEMVKLGHQGGVDLQQYTWKRCAEQLDRYLFA